MDSGHNNEHAPYLHEICARQQTFMHVIKSFLWEGLWFEGLARWRVRRGTKSDGV